MYRLHIHFFINNNDKKLVPIFLVFQITKSFKYNKFTKEYKYIIVIYSLKSYIYEYY